MMEIRFNNVSDLACGHPHFYVTTEAQAKRQS